MTINCQLLLQLLSKLQFTILYLGQIGLHGDGQTVRQGEVDWGGELAGAELRPGGHGDQVVVRHVVRVELEEDLGHASVHRGAQTGPIVLQNNLRTRKKVIMAANMQNKH